MSNIAKKLIKLAEMKKTVFSTNELAIAWKIENKNVLRVVIARAVKDGYLIALRRGLYRLTSIDVDKFELAGKIKIVSYISFETVLAVSGVIFQWYEPIFSASDRGSEIANEYGEFVYKKLPMRILLNNLGVVNKGNYFEASPERALCDKIYTDGVFYFDDLSSIDKDLIIEISKIYNKRVVDDVKKLFYENK